MSLLLREKGIAPDWWWVSTLLFQSKLHGDCYSVILIRISTQLIEIQAASLVQLRIIGKQLLPAIFCWNHHVSDRDFWNNIFLLTSSIRVLINSWNATSTHFINKNIIMSNRIMILRLQTKKVPSVTHKSGTTELLVLAMDLVVLLYASCVIIRNYGATSVGNGSCCFALCKLCYINNLSDNKQSRGRRKRTAPGRPHSWVVQVIYAIICGLFMFYYNKTQ